MAPTVANSVQAREVQALDRIRFKAIDAHLKSPPQSTSSTLLDRLASVKKAALVSVHGSGKAAALEVGCDQSQLNRQLQMGTFDGRQEAAAGEQYLAKLGELLTEEFGAAKKTKQEQAIERLPELLALMLDAMGVTK